MTFCQPVASGYRTCKSHGKIRKKRLKKWLSFLTESLVWLLSLRKIRTERTSNQANDHIRTSMKANESSASIIPCHPQCTVVYNGLDNRADKSQDIMNFHTH